MLLLLLLRQATVAAADRTYPLAGVPQPYPLIAAQGYPMTTAQGYPLAGSAQPYPLLTPQTYPLQ